MGMEVGRREKMIIRFFRSLRTWMRSLWSRKGRQSTSKQPAGLSPVPRTSPKRSANEQDRSSDRRSGQASTRYAGSADVENGDRSGKFFFAKSTTPIRNGPEVQSSSELPEGPRSESDSTPAEPNVDRRVPKSNGDVGGTSQPNLEDLDRESSERIEPSDDITSGESLESAEEKGEESESSLLPPWSPPPPSGNDGEGRGSKPGGPRNIPGRRNGPSRSPSQDEYVSKYRSTYRPKPELICRRTNALQWEVVLSAVEGYGIKEVRCDHVGKPLVMMKGEYSLPSLTGSLYIEQEDRETYELPLFNGTPLIFKMRNSWSGDGRKVGGITNGHYIVIVPNHWRRTGHIPVEAEVCKDSEYMAHYYYITKSPSAGDVGGFEKYALPLTDSYLELEGNRVFDDSDEGELFVGANLRLNTMPGVVWARIGEEKKGGWGLNFMPTEQTLLTDILNGQQGRFYIRVYDDEIKLLDSDEFRYMRDLREIRVNGETYTKNTLIGPPYSERTVLRFIGEAGSNLVPTIPQSTKYTKVCEDGRLFLDPHPNADTVSCELNSGDANSVRLVVMVPRVWWRIEVGESSISAKWRDKPLVTTQAELREYANSHAIIRVRLPRRVSSIRMGFGNNLDLKIGDLIDVGTSREFELDLYDFIDHTELDLRQPLKEGVSFYVQIESTVLPLIQIHADRTPEIVSFTSMPTEITIGEEVTLHWETRNAESSNVSIVPEIGQVQSSGSTRTPLYETLKFTLRLRVKGFKEISRSVMVKVCPRGDYKHDGELLTASEIKNRLMRLKDLQSITADVMAVFHFYKQDVERFLEGEFRTGRIRPSDETTDVIRFYEDMSDYACCPGKYRQDAKLRKRLRNTATTRRKQKLFNTDD